jgi:hypothetical protein
LQLKAEAIHLGVCHIPLVTSALLPVHEGLFIYPASSDSLALIAR